MGPRSCPTRLLTLRIMHPYSLYRCFRNPHLRYQHNQRPLRSGRTPRIPEPNKRRNRKSPRRVWGLEKAGISKDEES